MVQSRQQSRVAAIDEQAILCSGDFRTALRQLADAGHGNLPELEEYARKCLDELVVQPGDRYLSWIAALARFMYTRSFDAGFDVNAEALERVRALSRAHPMVFLWSHKSHLDGFVITRTLYDAGFRPQPMLFAGINMNFAGFGSLAKHSGAIFLRRSFRDDEVYRLVLRHFIYYLAARRIPLSWSIEGTRSRTGRLLPPRLGLIRWVTDAYRHASIDNALFVPVAISFDQIPEMDDYIAMQRGLPKRRESLSWFIEYIAGMKARFGKVYVRFAEPISLADAMSAGDTEEGDSSVRKLALEICNRIEHVIPITLTDLVTLVLLAANGRSLDAAQIWRQAQDVVRLIRHRNLPEADDLDVRDIDDLDERLASMTATGLLQCYADGAAPVYRITPGRQLAAAYYRNTIVHYFLSGALAETALAAARFDPSGSAFANALARLRDLLKFEFAFKAKDEFSHDALAYLDHRYPGWRTAGEAFADGPPPLFGQSILRSFVEAYRILARLLVKRGGRPVLAEHESALIGMCLTQGREMLLREEITTETALSRPLFVAAIRLARHRELLDSDDQALGNRRALFAMDVEQALEAINVLQAACDAQLGESRALPFEETRSIA